MEVKLAAKAGFCFGVKNAIEMAQATARERDGPIYTFGPLIHNPQAVRKLEEQGITKINDIDEIQGGGTLIIRSHGVGPGELARAGALNINLVDATCPFVSRAQRLARELTEAGFYVIVVGDRDHPEVQGIVGWTGDRATVVQTPEEAGLLPDKEAIAVLAQTTQPFSNFQSVVDVLKSKTSRLEVRNTICHATDERQRAARDLARKVDVMIVVGGKDSANTRKLTTLCQNTGTATYQVETAKELKPEWFKQAMVAGLTAGASTPGWIIEEVETRMKELGEMTGEMTGTEEGMKEAVDVKSVHPGEVVKGVVVQISQDEVLVDVGAKSEGVIPLRELSCCDVNSPQDVVKVGDEIEVYVLKAEDNEGKLILSKEKADAEKAWVVLQEKLDSGEVVDGKVAEVVKGGLLVDVGVRAFLPASLVERGYVEDLSKYLNTEIQAKVVELNRARKKVILSRKAILEEEYLKKREEILENIQEDQVVNGIVRRLTQFGAFVDIGGVDGLLHISEMAWHRINHPSEVVNVGDELEVMILRIDRENEKISLGLKQVLPNPWENVEDKYPVGAIVPAKVVRLAPFGAFVQLEPGVEGLVHISHLADRHVVKPDEVVQEGEEVKVKVLSVDPGEKRIRLSIREVNGGEREPRPVRESQNKNQYQDSGDAGNVTIGDVVGNLFKDDNNE